MDLEVCIRSQNLDTQKLLLIAERASQVPGIEVSVVHRADAEGHLAAQEKRPLVRHEDQVLSVERPSWESLVDEFREQLEKRPQQPVPPAARRGDYGAQPFPAQASNYSSTAHERSLLAIDIFSDLHEEDMRLLRQGITEHKYAKGQLIYLQEDRAQEVFLLERGRVQTYRLTASGKRLELATIPAGTFFGEIPLLGRTTHHASAEAVEDAVLGVVSRPALEQVLRERPTVAVRMIHELGQRLALSARRLEELAYQSAPTRLAAELLRLHQDYADTAIPITHQELGQITGLLRETVTKLLNEFKAAGLVDLHRGRIFLNDVVALQELLHDYEITPRPHQGLRPEAN